MKLGFFGNAYHDVHSNVFLYFADLPVSSSLYRLYSLPTNILELYIGDLIQTDHFPAKLRLLHQRVTGGLHCIILNYEAHCIILNYEAWLC